VIVSFKDEQNAVDVWDNITDDTVVYIPIKWSQTLGKEAMFVEVEDKQKGSFIVKIFLTKEDASAYKEKNVGKILSLAKTKLSYLTKKLNDTYAGKTDKRIFCAVFAKDATESFYPIDLVWSSTQSRN
jgi:hypothetical protein